MYSEQKMGDESFRRSTRRAGVILASALLVTIILILAWAQLGADDSKICKVAWWRWFGCVLQAHENLSGGLVAAAGALFAAWWAGTFVSRQLEEERNNRNEDRAHQGRLELERKQRDVTRLAKILKHRATAQNDAAALHNAYKSGHLDVLFESAFGPDVILLTKPAISLAKKIEQTGGTSSDVKEAERFFNAVSEIHEEASD